MSILRSASKCVFTNLAYEEHLLANFAKNTLFLWQNAPAVVIGRFQNPWLETDAQQLRECRVKMARRVSGGGTVYHDEGNLNLSFFTTRKEYNRKINLGLIRDAINELSGQERVTINQRDDIILDDKWKISGSAARLLRHESLHHCTLLVNANIDTLNRVLSATDHIETSATRSLRVDVKCLSDIGIDEPAQIDAPISRLWCGQYNGGVEVPIELVDPEQVDFVLERREELRSWKWQYGNTPRFELQTANFVAQINKGIIETVSITGGMELSSFEGERLERDYLLGMSFNSDTEKRARDEIVGFI